MDGPRKLTVKTKGEFGVMWADCEGIYNLSPKLVNGKAHWLQESGPNAIWSDNYFKNWKIGHVSNLGGSKCKILTNRNTGRDLPTKAFPWKYYTKNGGWTESEDIIVFKQFT